MGGREVVPEAAVERVASASIFAFVERFACRSNTHECSEGKKARRKWMSYAVEAGRGTVR
jgi:hypothetical protein